jgi:hypothetical protein
MEPDPTAAILHEIAEGFPLLGRFGSCIEKDHHLASGQKGRIQIAPIRGRAVREGIPLGHSGKPFVSFPDEALVRGLGPSRVKRLNMESRRRRAGALGDSLAEQE